MPLGFVRERKYTKNSLCGMQQKRTKLEDQKLTITWIHGNVIIAILTITVARSSMFLNNTSFVYMSTRCLSVCLGVHSTSYSCLHFSHIWPTHFDQRCPPVGNFLHHFFLQTDTWHIFHIFDQVSARLGVPRNFMFIACPGDRFPHDIGDFGGVRMITH